MEQYKKMDNTTPKKKGLGFTLVKRMKKECSWKTYMRNINVIYLSKY